MHFRWTFAAIPEKGRVIVQTVILSLAAAFGAVAFMTLINVVFKFLYIRASELSPWVFVAQSFFFTMVSSLLVALLLKKFPSAAGSGIPQVKAAYWKELGYMPFKIAAIKFVAGIISIGGGASLGREGPTVYMGSSIASNLAGITGTPKRLRRAASAIGASAGLAAAFNTPLAAITFSIEELINDLNTRYLGRVVLASLFGAMTVYAIVGRQPSFELPLVLPGSWGLYLVIPLVALLASLVGVSFQVSALSLRSRFKQQDSFPMWLGPCVGGFATWLIGSFIFLTTGKIGVFGLGYYDLTESLLHGSIWWIAGLLVAGKLLATIFSYSFGGCGGIFSPMLFIGGMSGAFVAGFVGQWFPSMSADHVILATVGMSACLGAVLRAPLTATLIVFEMTHQFEVVPGLMVSAVISQLVARYAGITHNFYDSLLLQDGHELIKIKPPQDLHSWQNLSVSHIMSRKPIYAETLDPESLRLLLSRNPYRCFPYVRHGTIVGIFTRGIIENALALGVSPEPLEPRMTTVTSTVKEASNLFISSPHNFLVITDVDTKLLVGILTLHDLLRAQAAVAE